MTQRRFAALDRDGTIIFEKHYLSYPDQVELLPGAAQGLRQLSALGLGLIVVTNQSAISRGFFDIRRLDQIHERLYKLLAAEQIHFDGIYFCPHLPDEGCFCRKPQTGLLELAAKELNFDPQESFVIGDNICDIDMGKNARATTLLVRTGYGSQVAAHSDRNPDYIVDGLSEAAQVIEQRILTNKKTVPDGARC